MSEEHGNLIKSPKQLITMVFASFFVPLIIILLLMTFVGNGKNKGAGTDQAAEATNNLIRPVAQLDFKDASGPKVYKSGEEVYKAVCASCHAAGAAGAPATGNNGSWAPRLSKGYDALLTSALKGKNAMPARGGAAPDDVSDFEIGRAIVHMGNASGGKLVEPKETVAKEDAKAEIKADEKKSAKK